MKGLLQHAQVSMCVRTQLGLAAVIQYDAELSPVNQTYMPANV